MKICELARKQGKVQCTFVHDKCVITPGLVKTKEGRAYTVRLTLIKLTRNLPLVGVLSLSAGMDPASR